jgi:serine/threonine protein phosphatase PrpC
VVKQLHVTAAEMTDVGRRRTTNQDNLAQRVPTDSYLLEQRGAIFVVADGMGGHAAGEIASTVAVQKIVSDYFDTESNDVLGALAHAIRAANEEILKISRENAEHMGMGTTLVAVVLCQGILYVANIGDSRVYIIRKNRLRQITEDHSWVAEQVRAGVLTEEQARNHVHRNVITRSLGTQPNIVADVFVEVAREGDTLLLCSDGLHGYVTDDDIAQTIMLYEPDEAAKRLVAMANDAGGPDNITVSIVRVNEIAAPPLEVLERLQLLEEQPRQTRPMPIIATGNSGGETSPMVARTAEHEEMPEEEPVPLIEKPRRRNRTRNVLIRLIAVAALIAFSAATWYVTVGPFAQAQKLAAQINSDISGAKSDIENIVSLSPSQQLSHLAQDQQKLSSDLKIADITADQRSRLQNTLSSIEQPARQALSSYNALAKIMPLSQAQVTPVSFTCSTLLSNPLLIASLDPAPVTPPPPAGTPPAPPVAFTGMLDSYGQLIPLSVSSTGATCGTKVGTIVNVIDATSTGNKIAMLVVPSSGAPTIQTITNASMSPGTELTINNLSSGARPTAMAYAYNSSTVAVAIHSASGDTLNIYTGGPAFDSNQTPTQIPLGSSVKSMAYGGNGLLYILMANGSLATYVSGHTTTHLVGDLQILPVLRITDPNGYTIATPLPTPQSSLVSQGDTSDKSSAYKWGTGAWSSSFPLYQQFDDAATATPTSTPTPAPTNTPTPTPLTGSSTSLPTAHSLIVENSASPRVIINDGEGHRIIVLQASGEDLTLAQQYTDESQLDQVQAITLTSNDHATSIVYVGGNYYTKVLLG